jgi:hypothetical protein
MIPYPAQQFMAKLPDAAVVEVRHAIYVSNPKAVAACSNQQRAASNRSY